MNDNIRKMLTDKYPFITLIRYVQDEYVGIIQNHDNQVTTLYDFGAIQDSELKRQFIELGSIWWWESNRLIPINIFLRKEMETFRYAIKNFTTKDVQILMGPVVNLNNIMLKRVKRRSVQLVRAKR